MKIIQQNEKQEDDHTDFFLKVISNECESIIGITRLKFKPTFGLKHEPIFYDITYVITDYSDYIPWYWYEIG